MPNINAGPAEHHAGLQALSYRVRMRSNRWTPATDGRSGPAAISRPSRPR